MKKFVSFVLALTLLLPVVQAGAEGENGSCAYNNHVFSNPGSTVCDICGEVYIASDDEIDDDDLDFDFDSRPDGNLDIGVFVCKIDGDFAYIVDCNTEIVGAVGIPSPLAGFNVVGIATAAFAGMTQITDIVIPQSIVAIADNAFNGCEALVNVWYTGSATDAESISVGSGNTAIINAAWHYNTCSNSHTYNGNCDATCDACEWIRTPAVEHDFDNACDTRCNVCGFSREITHEWKSAFTVTNTHHWVECNICGAKEAEPEAHDFTNSCDTSCNTCGHIRTITHRWNTKYSSNETTHWIECSVCHEKKTNPTYHTGGTATCKDLKQCTVCGAGYGSYAEHSPEYVAATQPDHNNTGNIAHWACIVCCKYFSDADAANELSAAEVIVPTVPHEFGDWITTETEHWKECLCQSEGERGEHDYTNDVDSTCDTCGYERSVNHSGWIAEGSKWTYYKNGTLVKNQWLQDAGKWYFLDADGYMLTNCWKKDSVGWCWLRSDGAMATNAWVKDSLGWCYVGENGYCVTNTWMKDSKGWCYLNSEGSQVKNNWVHHEGKWYFVDADGYMVSNKWMKDSKGWIYLGADGAMVTNGWVRDSIGWCYVGADGYAVTNTWKRDSRGWCYLNSEGSMVKSNWVQTDGKWYYLDADGYMISDAWLRHNGKEYYFDMSGVCTNP